MHIYKILKILFFYYLYIHKVKILYCLYNLSFTNYLIKK